MNWQLMVELAAEDVRCHSQLNHRLAGFLVMTLICGFVAIRISLSNIKKVYKQTMLSLV